MQRLRFHRQSSLRTELALDAPAVSGDFDEEQPETATAKNSNVAKWRNIRIDIIPDSGKRNSPFYSRFKLPEPFPYVSTKTLMDKRAENHGSDFCCQSAQ